MQGWQPVTSTAQFFSFSESVPLCCVYITAPWWVMMASVAHRPAEIALLPPPAAAALTAAAHWPLAGASAAAKLLTRWQDSLQIMQK